MYRSVRRSTAAFLTVAFLSWIVSGAGVAQEPATGHTPAAVRLAADGRALLPVVVSADAPDRVRRAAQSLATYLGRISDARFEFRTGDGTTGLANPTPRCRCD